MPRCSLGKWLLLVMIGLVPLGLFVYDQWFDDEYFDGKVAIKKDRQRPFQIDPDQPYEISYHRSSPMSGEVYEIVIKHNGQIELKESKRIGFRGDRTASFTIPPEAQAMILKGVETHRVMKLQQSYVHTDTVDGFHSSLVIRQGEREKRVYCSNHFPDGFKQFTDDLYAITGPYREKAERQVTQR